MATVELTDANFTETIKNNDLVLVDFWAAWCGPCTRFAPIFSKVSENHSDVVFGKLDTDANQQVAAALGVMSIPTVAAFRKGELVYNQAGVMSAIKLEKLIEELKA